MRQINLRLDTNIQRIKHDHAITQLWAFRATVDKSRVTSCRIRELSFACPTALQGTGSCDAWSEPRKICKAPNHHHQPQFVVSPFRVFVRVVLFCRIASLHLLSIITIIIIIYSLSHYCSCVSFLARPSTSIPPLGQAASLKPTPSYRLAPNILKRDAQRAATVLRISRDLRVRDRPVTPRCEGY